SNPLAFRRSVHLDICYVITSLMQGMNAIFSQDDRLPVPVLSGFGSRKDNAAEPCPDKGPISAAS
ncbi:hypothetical protein, partial [Paracoccus sp. (in: a-proteobacteria)]|uniref:hypothetical protein n=1 Tax=Paracoccus sp. TaxID=267 RepID=UPI0028B02C9A